MIPASTLHNKTKYQFTVMTPMFGGGVEPRISDPLSPIRGTSIRGHLRFWWRAVRSRTLAPDALRQREWEVWGSTAAASPYRLAVEIVSEGDDLDLSRWKLEVPDYVSFPFRPQRGARNAPVTRARTGIRFELNFAFRNDEVRSEIELALKAWTAFGGIGSRTRRGCGTLWSPELSPHDARDLAVGLKDFSPFTAPPFTWDKPAHTVLRSWMTVIDHYKGFRQSPTGRTGLSRSHWPEADTMRRHSGKGNPAHMISATIPVGTPDQFPRAVFGLPIVFHYKDPDGAYTNLDSKNNSTLNNLAGPKQDEGRLASPLVLKALVFQNKNFQPFVGLLRSVLPEGVSLVFDDDTIPSIRQSPFGLDRTAMSYPGSPTGSKRNPANPIDAFFLYLHGLGYRPIK